MTALLMPAVVKSLDVDDAAGVSLSMTQLAFMLAAHRSTNGAYPESLSELNLRSLSKLPLDLYADDDFRYELRGTGYILYSVGRNRKDDGGHEAESVLADTGDIVILAP